MRIQVKQFLESESISNGKILVAVSGGADSVALLLLLLDVCDRFRLQVIVAHYDHAVREDSAADAKWVQALSNELGVTCHVEQMQARGGRHSASEEQFSEDALRTARYAFLERTAREFDCQWIALGHTADDQAETVLHHLIRGTGLRGLAGMPFVRELAPGIQLIRPLFQVTRAEVEAELQARNQPWRTDLTNASDQYLRNRIRHEVMPLLKTLNRKTARHLQQLSEQASEHQTAIVDIAASVLERAIQERASHRVTIDCRFLKASHHVIIRECFVQLWHQQNWTRQEMTSMHWRTLASVVCEASPTGISLPGKVEASRSQGVLTLKCSQDHESEPSSQVS